eukprot:TRINITY_DN2604_c0_g1_i3.p1 TRINITY_DN2604_c0_g1~~TRINITY_DN2604_c0_g1_i3.p1  ORF type:complete len:180 (-),score=32.42 TRINITY_DN2604_c0_g1_i3:46-585(-)
MREHTDSSSGGEAVEGCARIIQNPCHDAFILSVLNEKDVEAVAREEQQADGHHVWHRPQVLEHETVAIAARNGHPNPYDQRNNDRENGKRGARKLLIVEDPSRGEVNTHTTEEDPRQGEEKCSSHLRIFFERCAYGFHCCLLYTSDAADDLLCVDLGGRRIIKKKKNINQTVTETIQNK